MNKDLVEYVQLMLSQGKEKVEIESTLLQVGWSSDIVKAVLFPENNVSIPKPISIPSPINNEIAIKNVDPVVNKSLNTQNSFMIGFLYSLNFISLWIGTIAFLILIFAIIDKLIPNNITDPYSYSSSYANSVVNGSVSCLVICVPIFLFLFIYLKKQIIEHTQYRQYKLRKVLIILTLVACFLTGIGYLISLLNSFLSGNITINFFLQVFTVVFLLGIIFAYYLILYFHFEGQINLKNKL